MQFTGCKQNEEFAHEAAPQLLRNPCGHLDTEDLDLSEGFKGTYGAKVAGRNSDFSVEGHDPMYAFSAPVMPADCQGVCAIRIEFRQSNSESTWGPADFQIADITFGYETDSSTVTSTATDYDWAFPILDIYQTYTNATIFYDVDFENQLGSELEIKEVTVMDGLCVVDNVQEVDPPYVVTSKDEGGGTN